MVKEGHDSTVRPKVQTYEFDNGRMFLDAWASDGNAIRRGARAGECWSCGEPWRPSLASGRFSARGVARGCVASVELAVQAPA